MSKKNNLIPVHTFETHHQWVKARNLVRPGDICVDASGQMCNIGEDFANAAYPVEVLRAAKVNKMGAREIEIDGYIFKSEFEGTRYQELKLLEAAGEITDLELQPPFVLQDKYRDMHGVAQRAIKYIADFAYNEPGNPLRVVEDTKGHQSEKSKVQVKLFRWKYEYPRGPYELRIIRE